jgi:NADPH:quinone reductase-like Zn-dependent oxidoreductase
MKAVIIPRHGDPDVLEYAEMPEPRIQDHEVLLKVGACALNHLDLWVRRGRPGVQIPLPHIPGSDVAGEVAKVGRHVSSVKVGERVVVAPGLSCGLCAECQAGDDNLCRRYTVLGFLVDGGCAEYVRIPDTNLFPMPDTLSYEEAAAVPLVFLTAWHMLLNRARLAPGEDVLILGAGSGVGSAAIQIARMAGARIFATIGKESKREKALELGADVVFNHNDVDFAEEIRRLTDRRGVDVVLEHVGESTWKQSLASLAVGGRLVTCGATTGTQAGFDLRTLFSRNLSILGSYMGRRSELIPILKLVGERKLRPVIDSVLPLSRAAQGHARMEQREHFGKIVLVP